METMNDKNSGANAPIRKIYREPTRIFQLRAGDVCEFQGQPKMVQSCRDLGDGLVVLSVRPAQEPVTEDHEISLKDKSYDLWAFSTRPIAGSVKIDRFYRRGSARELTR